MNTALWIVAVLMIVVGVVGTVLPALPGVVFVFAGIVLAAWINGFTLISGWTVGLLAALTLLGFLVDYLATLFTAQRAGATVPGLIGAAVGTIAGVLSGLWGLIFMPLAGAAIGEYIAHSDALRAGRVGLATWLGLLLGAVLKLAVVFTMVGVFLLALLF